MSTFFFYPIAWDDWDENCRRWKHRQIPANFTMLKHSSGHRLHQHWANAGPEPRVCPARIVLICKPGGCCQTSCDFHQYLSRTRGTWQVLWWSRLASLRERSWSGVLEATARCPSRPITWLRSRSVVLKISSLRYNNICFCGSGQILKQRK